MLPSFFFAGRLGDKKSIGTSQDATWTLGYNPAGQVVSRALSNSAYAYTAQPTLDDDNTNNGLNQVTAVDSTGVTYDGRGNITGDGTSEWNYDASNRITHGDYTGIDIGTYSYDPASRLSRITATGVNSRFLYAGAQAVGEYDSSGALIRRYVLGAGLDDYAAYTVGTTTITRDWPVTDPLGSVVGLTNGSNVATTINTYDEYGVPGSGFSGRFGYAGSMYLNRAMAAPWNMRNRQYNPTLGRFMQTDPIGIAGGLNLYGYVGNDPVNLVDPWGLQDCIPLPGEDCVGGVTVTGKRPRGPTMVSPSGYQYVSGLGWTWFGVDKVSDILVIGQRIVDPAIPRCPTGPRLVLGGGYSGTLFAAIVGGSVGGQSEVSIPLESIINGSFRGTQISGNYSVTALVGFGGFVGAGPSVSAGGSPTARQPGFYSESNWLWQAGAGDGGGVEVSVPVPVSSASGSMGPRGAFGAYGAGGRQWRVGYAFPPIGCRG